MTLVYGSWNFSQKKFQDLGRNWRWGYYSNCVCIYVQLRRQTNNGFLVVEWALVNDFRQVHIWTSECQQIAISFHL